MTTALNAALAYADRGWHVFPVQPPPNKKPILKSEVEGEGGFREATTDHAQINAWWADYPSAQVGVACGVSGILAVDLDEKPKEGISGKASLDEIWIDADSCDLIMGTPRNGGRQLFYAGRDTRRQLAVLPGVDLLGDGGYTIVPSPASPGREWLVGDPLDPDDLEPMPGWLRHLNDLRGRKVASNPHSPLKGGGLGDDLIDIKITPLDEKQVDEIEAAMGYIPNDDRGVWIKVGMALKSTGAGEQAYEIWEAWSKTSAKFNARDQRYQWDRLHALKMDGSEVTLATLFWMAKEHGYDQADIEVSAPDTPKTLLAPQEIELLDWTDVAELPPIEWQIEGLIPRASISVLAGDTEAGKTFAWIDMAMRLVHGLPFAGLPVEQGSVIYLTGEGQAGMAARFRAWRRHHAHLGLDAGDHYCVVSSEIPVLSKQTMGTLHDLVARVIEWKGHAPAMTIIDTLSQGLDDDENAASVISPVIRGLMALRRLCGTSIGLAHHLVKLQAAGRRKGQEAPQATRDSVRGSSALTRNIDTVLGLLSDENDGPRRLCVWKQKDGSKLDAIDFWLLPVLTGRERVGGQEEWSCILIPDVCERIIEDADKNQTPDVEDPTAPNPRAIAAHKAAIEKIVATLTEFGAIEGENSRGAMSGNEICAASGVKRGVTLAAIKGAAREGLIVNTGTEKAARWVVPDGSGTSNGRPDK